MQSQPSQRVPMARFPALVAIMRRLAPPRLNRARRMLAPPTRPVDVDLAQRVRESGEW